MIRRVASLTSSSRPAGDDRRPSITSESDWRVRIDAGTLFAMGCLLAGAGSHRRRFANPKRGCTPTKFSSKIRPSPVLGLADRLRTDGIDAEVDQYNAAPLEGWPLWCERQIDTADVVLMICTETYH